MICRNVHALGQLTMSMNQEKAFIIAGFNNWKDTTQSFEQHCKSLCHREASLKGGSHAQGRFNIFM